MSNQAPPTGFTPHFRKSGLTDPWEPLYSLVEPDRVKIGLYLGEAHCNSRGLVHGGLIATLADNSMGLSCAQLAKAGGEDVQGLVTISLHTDFVSSAKLGAWMEVDTDYVKTGRSVCFAQAKVIADGDVIATASGTFKMLTANS